jgi:ATP-binding cassette subfamily B protein
LFAPVGISHLEDPRLRDEIARANGAGTGVTPGAAMNSLVTVLTSRAQAVGALGVLATVRWWLAVPLAVVHLASAGFWRSNYKRLTSWATERTSELRRGDWFRDTAMGTAAAKEIRLFGLGDWMADGFHAHWRAGMSSVWRGWRNDRPKVALSVLAPAVATFFVALVVGDSVLAGDITLATAVVALQAVAVSNTLSTASDGARLLTAGAAASRAGEAVARLVTTTRPSIARSAAGLPKTSIRFVDVSFRYPGRDTWALKNFSLDVAAGTSVAVVGLNGAGKTTLVRLLARLVEPHDGQIEIDGVSLDQLDPVSWRRQLAVLFQDFVRHPLDLRDNVGMGRLDLIDDAELLHRVVDRGGAGRVVDRVGWTAPLSRQRTGGTDLSGGEWQRVATARALLAVEGGASVLVLDEPAASLDVRAEAELHDRFLEMTANVTTFVISHRFSTVRPADRIVVLEHGRVAEDGDHNALLAARGRYAELFELQASRFGVGHA